MTATRTREGWNISAIIDGYLVSKLYIGYTKAEAIKIFRESHRKTW